MITASIFSAVDATKTQRSVPLEVGDLFQYSVQVWFSGVAAGSLTLMVSNIGGTSDADYVILPGATQTIAAGNSHLWNVSGAAYRWVRVKLTPTAGVGTVSANAVIKQPINRY